jgi:ubiquinone biosynthesis monooxygenase Coq7
MSFKHSKLPGGISKQKELASMIRVDHAGEYGARKIYEGQLAILKGHKEIKHMYEQELAHLEYFEKELVRRKVRPTVFTPLWSMGAFMLGAASALLGEKAAMACTTAVEEVIDEHYKQQVEKLGQHKDEEILRKKIEKFRAEELEHRDTGLEHGAKEMFGYGIFTKAVKRITKTAILLSKRW